MARIRDVVGAARGLPPKELGRALLRSPLVARAEEQLDALPVVELVELVGSEPFEAALAAPEFRHSWSLGAVEQLVLQALIRRRGIRSAFEIGTFNGGTTRLIAETLPPDGRVVTLDLPADRFDATQSPEGFTGADVGRAYGTSPAAALVTSLREDSLLFDPTPYHGAFDLVLVDGGHEYEHGVADTRTALAVVAPGGLVLWDDFQPYWHGLVRGICEGMRDRRLFRLAGTSFGGYVAEP